MDGARIAGWLAAAGRGARRLHSVRFSAQQRLHLAALLIAFARVAAVRADDIDVQSDHHAGGLRDVLAPRRRRRSSPRPCSRRAPAACSASTSAIAATAVPIDNERGVLAQCGADVDFSTQRLRRRPASGGVEGLRRSATISGSYAKCRTAASRRGAARSTCRSSAAASLTPELGAPRRRTRR